MHITPDDLAKVRSLQLRMIAEEGANLSNVVVVKVLTTDAPRLQIGRSEFGEARSIGFALTGASEPRGTLLDKTRKEIERITHRDALNVFASSNSIVVEADGSQIAQIAALPNVEAIYPNETLR
ncbi:hypothetical protein [Allosphingosinicella deserti]|uniref:Uncharacterized protein n=1 Tax=Allosphingosinicella deserti TaxID=2116704 RepID=A0A2P7QF95_9SPHN|nr:hypothetical protein [Sphingomonas deserti]PSJ36633.1 hypothetical protein C7I55_24890 [Sphingomonas deserti]